MLDQYGEEIPEDLIALILIGCNKDDIDKIMGVKWYELENSNILLVSFDETKDLPMFSEDEIQFKNRKRNRIADPLKRYEIDYLNEEVIFYYA